MDRQHDDYFDHDEDRFIKCYVCGARFGESCECESESVVFCPDCGEKLRPYVTVHECYPEGMSSARRIEKLSYFIDVYRARCDHLMAGIQQREDHMRRCCKLMGEEKETFYRTLKDSIGHLARAIDYYDEMEEALRRTERKLKRLEASLLAELDAEKKLP